MPDAVKMVAVGRPRAGHCLASKRFIMLNVRLWLLVRACTMPRLEVVCALFGFLGHKPYRDGLQSVLWHISMLDYDFRVKLSYAAASQSAWAPAL